MTIRIVLILIALTGCTFINTSNSPNTKVLYRDSSKADYGVNLIEQEEYHDASDTSEEGRQVPRSGTSDWPTRP